jgi:nucleotide-binding universal stress UspA family protein
MKRITRILVPVDFTDYSTRAADYAAMLARRFRATIILIHAIGPFTYDVTDAALVVDHYASLHTIADRLMTGLRNRLARRGAAVRTVIRQGNPALEIIGEARRRRANLIVMGTHGRTGLEHLVLGSVAERVVRFAPCPVLTVGSGRGPKHRKPLPLI